jgi:hypothetical protein
MGQASMPSWRTSTSHDHGSPSGQGPGKPLQGPKLSADARHSEEPSAGNLPAGICAGAVG